MWLSGLVVEGPAPFEFNTVQYSVELEQSQTFHNQPAEPHGIPLQDNLITAFKEINTLSKGAIHITEKNHHQRKHTSPRNAQD